MIIGEEMIFNGNFTKVLEAFMGFEKNLKIISLELLRDEMKSYMKTDFESNCVEISEILRKLNKNWL